METKGSRSSYREEVTTSRSSSGPRSRTSYTPAIQSRNTFVTRGEPGSGGLKHGFDMRSSMSQALTLNPGTYTHISNEGVAHVKEDRTKEKKEMRDLNERLANYIEKVRFLEAQNKALIAEIEKLRRPVDLDKIKQMYESELNQARIVIDELSKDKANFDVKIVSLEDQLAWERSEREREANEKADLFDKYNRLSDHVGEVEGELVTLRGRVESLEGENKTLRETVRKYQDEINRLRSDLDAETLAHINESNQKQSLAEQLNFITGVYEAEIKELTDLANRDTTIEMRQFWKGEMGKAMRDIQTEFDARLELMREDMETKYSFQIRELRAGTQKDSFEVNHMRDELKKCRERLSDSNIKLADLSAKLAAMTEANRNLEEQLREAIREHEAESAKFKAELATLHQEMESMLQELQTLMDAKLSLELEIAAYRKLLEGEESRLTVKSAVEIAGNYVTRSGSAMDKVVQSSGKRSWQNEGRIQSSESVGRLSVNKTARGSVNICEVAPDGRYLLLENSSYTKKQPLKGWKVKRVSGDQKYEYALPDMEMKPGTLKIWARNAAKGNEKKSGDLEALDFTTWGVGSCKTILQDEAAVEKATHDQTFTM